MEKNHSSIFSAISYSYIHYIDEYLTVLTNPLLSSVSYLDESTQSILEEVKTLFLTLPTLLNESSEIRQETTSLILRLRTELEQKYRSLHAYKRELQYLTFSASYMHALEYSSYEDFNMTEKEALQIDFEKIAQDAADFIFSENHPIKKQEKTSAILPFVPMRMTKDSFLRYVENSIQSIQIDNQKEAAIELISVLNQLLDGKNYSGYGKDFKDFADSIAALTEEEDMDIFFEDADLLNETLEQCTTLIHSLYRSLCLFSNFLIFDGLTFEALTDLHLSFYDLYCSIQNILNQHEDKDLLLETLPEKVKGFKAPLKKVYEKKTQSEKLDPLLALIQTHLHLDISNVFGFHAGAHDPYLPEVKEVFEDFLASTKEYLLTKSPGERKRRMQYFISMIPFKMNKEQLLSYLKHGFTATTNPKGNLFTAMLIENVLRESDFFEQQEEHLHDHTHTHDHEHDHHHHDCHGHEHDGPHHH